MSSFRFLLLVLFCLIVCFSFVSGAVDVKAKIKYCEFAISNTDVDKWEFEDSVDGTPEPDVFKQWNDSTQTGIFLKIENNNLILGESSDYSYERYTGDIPWYNEFNHTSGLTSDIPIINVGADNATYLYGRCKFVVGNYRIFLNKLNNNYDCGFSTNHHLTNDFNLTTGLITEDISSGNPPVSRGFRLSGFQTSSNRNKINNLHPSEEGFFPYTEPYIIYFHRDLSKIPTSYFRGHMSWLLRETGSVDVCSDPYNSRPLFYINNSDPNYDVMESLVVTPLYSSVILRDETLDINDSHLKLIPGNNYSYRIKFNNTWDFPINMSFYNMRFGQESGPWRRGIGELTDVEIFKVPGIDQDINFGPGEVKELFYSSIIPNSTGSFITVETRFYMSYKNRFGNSGGLWFSSGGLGIASDEYPYLSFKRIDPRIEFIKVNASYQPVFNVTVELYVESHNHCLNVNREDYTLESRLYEGSFSPDKLVHIETYELPSDLNRGSTTPFNFLIPINSSFKNEKYYVRFFTKMEKVIPPHPEFQGKYIASYPGDPYIKAGEIAYPDKNILKFGSDSRVDRGTFFIFNPTFYYNDITLNVKEWSNSSFKIKFEGQEFGQESKTFNLYPLEMKLVTFLVNATYEPWVSSYEEESLILTVSSDLYTGEETTNKSNDLDFILDVDSESIYWFDLNPLRSEPSGIYLDYSSPERNENINLFWGVEGSNSGISGNFGEPYVVDFKLVNSSGDVLKSESKQFSVESSKEENISFNYDFKEGDYSILFNITSEMNEYDSGGFNMKDNYREWDLKVRLKKCLYNQSDGSLYYIDFFGDWQKDRDCEECQCPSDFRCVREFGFCANISGECNYDNISSCNDWYPNREDLCNWKCDNGNCPPNTNINDGECLPCKEIKTCGDYNNNMTCEADPCFIKDDDCNAVSCEKSVDYECFWDYTENQCNFNSTVCTYNITLENECGRLGEEYRYIRYEGFPEFCGSKTKQIFCHSVEKLSFFSWKQIIISLILVFIIYYFFRD